MINETVPAGHRAQAPHPAASPLPYGNSVSGASGATPGRYTPANSFSTSPFRALSLPEWLRRQLGLPVGNSDGPCRLHRRRNRSWRHYCGGRGRRNRRAGPYRRSKAKVGRERGRWIKGLDMRRILGPSSSSARKWVEDTLVILAGPKERRESSRDSLWRWRSYRKLRAVVGRLMANLGSLP